MPGVTPQRLENHARYVPLYHFVLGALLFLNFGHETLALRHYSPEVLFRWIVALALVLASIYARLFALAAQNRVIRLELRLRVRELAPDVQGRFDELNVEQVVALRFAGDGELAALTREVLEGRLRTGVEIKRRITDWKADHWRV